MLSGYRAPVTNLEPDLETIAKFGLKILNAGDLNANHEELNSKVYNDVGDVLHDFLAT